MKPELDDRLDWLPGSDVTLPCLPESATGMLVDDLLGDEPIFAVDAFTHGRNEFGFRKPCCCEDWDGEK